MTQLAEIQRLLWRLITAPEGVGAALSADSDRGGEMAATLHRTVRPGARLNAALRLDIYANMYFFRLLDVLKEDYPAVLAVLGDTAFHNLVTDYLLRHPPAHYSIRHAGDSLPAFAATHPLTEIRADLAALARFEHALKDAFDAPDHSIVGPADLAALAPERWAGLRFRLHPSLRLLDCNWAVRELRERVDRGERPGPPQPADVHLCVWRRGLDVLHQPLDGLDAAALRGADAGATFADKCAAAAADDDLVSAAGRVAGALAGWLARGWIAELL